VYKDTHTSKSHIELFFHMPLCNTVTCQLVLSAIQTHRLGKLSSGNEKKFSFGFFIGDIISWIELVFLAEDIRPWAPTSRRKHFAQVFSRN